MLLHPFTSRFVLWPDTLRIPQDRMKTNPTAAASTEQAMWLYSEDIGIIQKFPLPLILTWPTGL
jgi:hypothetical protein